MSDRKLAKAVQSLLRQIWRLHRSITKATVTWLLRTALLINRKGRYATAGFVLPTTVLLILVVTLTAGAITYRAFNTSSRTIAEAQNRVIYNAATPAIDRARSKLEFMFDATKDTRFPGGVPSEEVLVSMLLNGKPAISVKGETAAGTLEYPGGEDNGLGNSQDPYTLPDEDRVDINRDGKVDNAWSYRIDTDGNGQADATVIYSVLLSTPPDAPNNPGWKKLIGMTDRAKADGEADNGRTISYVRHGPLSNASKAAGCRVSGASSGAAVDAGWYEDTVSTSKLSKNFQVDAFVVSDNTGATGSGNFTTLEFSQDRVVERGNKWGAWFRNDLEIFPGPQFNWNGAMHTEGSLIIGNNSFNAYLISAPSSCLFYPSASEITITETEDAAFPRPDNKFNGILASGKVNDSSYGGSALIYLHTNNPTLAASQRTLTPANDWANGSNPFEISLNPIEVFLRNGYRSRAPIPTNGSYFDNDPNDFAGRIKSEKAEAPYVDDTYRADNRYGPKLTYDQTSAIPNGKRLGEIILPNDNVSRDPTKTVLADTKLLTATPAGVDSANVGLDGYWERRARNQGLRIIVGQRLELGNSNGWVPPQNRPDDGDPERPRLQPQNPALPVVAPNNTNLTDLRTAPVLPSAPPSLPGDLESEIGPAPNQRVDLADPDTSDNEGDPLYPPHDPISNDNRKHEHIQRRALRDNIAAVQSAAIYHAAVDRDYPVACIAATAHPGSPFSLRQSINFVPTFFVDSAPNGTNNLSSGQDTVLLSDFFNGRGTNGWEFEPPLGTAAAFEQAMNDPDSPMRIALTNLAQFAGDHVSDALTGAFPPTQEAARPHPYPDLTMWGNFSNLRRTLDRLGATAYRDLSPADKTNLQTAACTMGMLAHNIDRVQHFDPRNLNNDKARFGTSNVMFSLARDLNELMNGVVNEAAGEFEVLPRSQLATYNYDNNGTYSADRYNPRDYDRVPAEAFLGKLRERYRASTNAFPPPAKEAELRMAELIFAHFQIRRDRTYGFRPSPAANTWNYNPYVARYSNRQVHLWSSACDPNVFSFRGFPPSSQSVGKDAADLSPTATPTVDRLRLSLSRLCGTVIPAGAVHDYPGDYGLPQRNRSVRRTDPVQSVGSDLAEQYIPRINGVPRKYIYTAEQTPSPETFRTTPLNSVNGQNQLLYNLSGDTNGNPELWNRGVYLQATVAPKWPSLYYLFPEVDHNQDGSEVYGAGLVHKNGVIDVQKDGIGLTSPTSPPGTSTNPNPNNDGDWSDDVDQRQPTGSLRDWLSSGDPGSGIVLPGQASNAKLIPAAFQPWVEPYIMDDYIRQTVNRTVRYRVVDSVAPDILSPVGQGYPEIGGYTSGLLTLGSSYSGEIQDTQGGTPETATYTYRTFVNPLADRPVGAVAVKPRKLPAGFTNPFPLESNQPWQLPISVLPANPPAQNVPPNRIIVPNGDRMTGPTAVIPFLDRVMFNGREWQPARVLDIDLGMLRRTRPAANIQGGQNASPEAYSPDVWLPVSGIVYAFREDAVREDAIARPASGTVSDARNPNAPTDPSVRTASLSGSTTCTTQPCLSIKAVDGVPDPDRRVHGFRLRNGRVLSRHPDMGIPIQDNIRGLSFFTDQPVYIMGDYNLHQAGVDNDATGTRLEEFTQLLPDNALYTPVQFYTNRTTRETRFADPAQDRWRPSEILADAISVISDTLCDGSAIDTFMTANNGNGATIVEATYSGRTTTDSNTALPNGFYPYRRTTGDAGGVTVYNNSSAGLFGPGCTDGNRRTTFLNQNRPENTLPGNWSWLRENPNDIFSAVKISRNGQGMVLPPLPPATPNTNPPDYAVHTPFAALPSKPRRGGVYTDNPVNGDYYTIDDGRSVQNAQDSRVNSIIVSGLVPSRQNQSYGGLHNFPRFVERWTRLWFAGSFLQLNFSNYATAPFDAEATEPGTNPTADEKIPYYSPPSRLWGYDVALQLAPAGPAASRFVTAGKARNEFYSEPPVNDPYINNLCRALPDSIIPDNRCPS